MDINGQVLGCTAKQTSRGMLYKVAFSDGNEYTTFENDLAKKANSLVGSPVSARVNVSQKGQYTNRYLNDIAPEGQLPLEDMQGAAGQTVDGILIEQPAQRGGRGGGGKGMTEADKTRMSKQNALSTAFLSLAQLYQGAGPEAAAELEERAMALAGRIYNKGRDHEVGTQAGVNVTPVPTTPQEVAAAVPGVQVGVSEAPEAAQPDAPTPTW